MACSNFNRTEVKSNDKRNTYNKEGFFITNYDDELSVIQTHSPLKILALPAPTHNELSDTKIKKFKQTYEGHMNEFSKESCRLRNKAYSFNHIISV